MSKCDISEYESLSSDLAFSLHLSPLPSQTHSAGSYVELIPMRITPVVERWLQVCPTYTLHICQLASKAICVHALFVALQQKHVCGYHAKCRYVLKAVDLVLRVSPGVSFAACDMTHQLAKMSTVNFYRLLPECSVAASYKAVSKTCFAFSCRSAHAMPRMHDVSL